MTLLPIAHRELRVAARGRATRRWRIFFAVAAVVIAGGVGFIARQGQGVFGAQAGIWIFNTLKYVVFGAACLAGVFLTSDCLSEEKREGTLGLLFLTDLRGYDVVIGKLLATSLGAFYGLLAVFPVMALSFVLGGIPAEEFWHSVVSICNALFFSLTLGMAISAVSRDSNRAMTGTFLLLAVFVFIVPGFAQDKIAFLSPAYSLTLAAVAYRVNDFWLSIAVVHLSGWAMLAFASWLAPRTWQEKGARKAWRFAKSKGRELLEQEPIAWIVARDRWAANISRAAVVVILLSLVIGIMSYSKAAPATATVTPSAPPAMVSSSKAVTNANGSVYYTYSASSSTVVIANSRFYRIGNWIGGLLSYALELWLAAQVSRFYVEGRKNGFFELLWVTPVRSAEIIRGQWVGLRRLFLAPIVAQLVLTLVMSAINIAAAYTPSTASASPFNMTEFQIITAVMSPLSWTVSMFAIAWFSIWMGVKSKNLNLAVLKTFLFVKVIPWMGVGFLSMIVFIGAATASLAKIAGAAPYLMVLIPQSLIIAVNFGLIAFARGQSRDALAKLPELASAR